MAYRKLGRTSAHRKAMLRNLTTDLIVNEKIVTTETRAKEVRKFVEKMITLGKKGDLASRRRAAAFVMNVVADVKEENDDVVVQSALQKLFDCPEVYESLTGRPYLFKVQKGLEAALSHGLKVKVNVVLQEGINDGEWKNLTELAKDAPLDVRFIELMPIGYGKRGKGIAGDEILKKLTQDFGPLKEDVEIHGNGPARYVRIPGYKGSVGFISAMHGKFCDSCNRLRLTSTGEIKPCLCYGESFPIRELLRSGDLDGVREILKEAILKKPAEHCFTEIEKVTETKRMTEIGG